MIARIAAVAIGAALAVASCHGTAKPPAPRRTTTVEPKRAKPKPRPARPAVAATVAPDPPVAVAPAGSQVERGFAVWYGRGKMTASGERFDKRAMAAAHRTLPFGTRVRVTHARTGKSVVVRINDRGPYGKKRERIIDLTEAAAAVIGIIEAGVAPVTVEILEGP